MRVFDRIDPVDLDRREIHLRMLAITVIVVLSLGLGLMMYPTVFAKPMTSSRSTFETIFFGFCTLSVLLIAYLLDRHLLIGRLRLRVVPRERAIEILQQEASKDFLTFLPAFDSFTDRLAMEFRRVSRVREPLSLLAVEIRVRAEVCGSSETEVVYADAGQTILRRIPGEDSMFHLDPGAFGILPPRASTANAGRVKARIK